MRACGPIAADRPARSATRCWRRRLLRELQIKRTAQNALTQGLHRSVAIDKATMAQCHSGISTDVSISKGVPKEWGLSQR